MVDNHYVIPFLAHVSLQESPLEPNSRCISSVGGHCSPCSQKSWKNDISFSNQKHIVTLFPNGRTMNLIAINLCWLALSDSIASKGFKRTYTLKRDIEGQLQWRWINLPLCWNKLYSKCDINIRGVFRVGGGRAVNPWNVGSVASTWHLVFSFFSFQGKLCYTLINLIKYYNDIFVKN